MIQEKMEYYDFTFEKPDLAAFEAAFERLCRIAGSEKTDDLMRFVGARYSSFAYARRHARIPMSWLVHLLFERHISPRWIIFGEGEIHIPGGSPDHSPDQQSAMRETLHAISFLLFSENMCIKECYKSDTF